MALRSAGEPFFLADMKIAIVGCGALGSFYGAILCRTGADVWFLLRSDFAAVRDRGVQVRSPLGHFQVHPKTAQHPADIGPVDLVVIGLKTTANDRLAPLVAPLLQCNTSVLTLQNGLGNEEALARFIPPEQILGGLCFVCLNRTAPGHIEHIDHGRVVLGEFQRQPLPRTHSIADLFRSGVPCDVTDNLARAHWEKLAWNIPFNGLGVASCAGLDAVLHGRPDARPLPDAPCLTTDRLLADPRWEKLARELILEVIQAARGCGHPLDDSQVELQIQRTQTMGAYKPSTLIDFERGQPLELDSLFLEPLRQARQAGVAAPRLENLTRVLCALDPARQNG